MEVSGSRIDEGGEGIGGDDVSRVGAEEREKDVLAGRACIWGR